MSAPFRTCILCTKRDDHPKHVVVTGDVESVRHMDCCALATDCSICKAQLDGVGGVEGNPKGGALREHLLTTGPGAGQAGWTAPVDETVEG